MAPTPSTAIPPSQNTAPVFEYSCLFTHDLRRKAKRWQDGFLKFHTFNNRVMVYDATRNYIGDTYQRNGLDEGDELELERRGVLVQVSEKVATEETDISEIIAKRTPKPIEKENGGGHVSQSHPRSTNLGIPPRTPGTWSGWTGRAHIPQESPYAHRQAGNTTQTDGDTNRAAKRQRTDDDEHVSLNDILRTNRQPSRAAAAFGNHAAPNSSAMLPGSVRPKSTSATPVVPKKKSIGLPPGQAKLQVQRVINIPSSPQIVDNGGPGQQARDRGGVFNSSSPAKPPPRKTREPPPKVNIVQEKLTKSIGGRQLGPLNANVTRAFKPLSTQPDSQNAIDQPQIQERLTKTKQQQKQSESQPQSVISMQAPTAKPRVKPVKPRPPVEAVTPRRQLPSSPSVSVRNHISAAVEVVPVDASEDEQEQHAATRNEQPKIPMKPLRLGGSSRPKMLMCQQLPASRPATPVTADASRGNEVKTGASTGARTLERQQKRRDFLEAMADSSPAFSTMDANIPPRPPAPLPQKPKVKPKMTMFEEDDFDEPVSIPIEDTVDLTPQEYKSSSALKERKDDRGHRKSASQHDKHTVEARPPAEPETLPAHSPVADGPALPPSQVEDAAKPARRAPIDAQSSSTILEASDKPSKQPLAEIPVTTDIHAAPTTKAPPRVAQTAKKVVTPIVEAPPAVVQPPKDVMPQMNKSPPPIAGTHKDVAAPIAEAPPPVAPLPKEVAAPFPPSVASRSGKDDSHRVIKTAMPQALQQQMLPPSIPPTFKPPPQKPPPPQSQKGQHLPLQTKETPNFPEATIPAASKATEPRIPPPKVAPKPQPQVRSLPAPQVIPTPQPQVTPVPAPKAAPKPPPNLSHRPLRRAASDAGTRSPTKYLPDTPSANPALPTDDSPLPLHAAPGPAPPPGFHPTDPAPKPRTKKPIGRSTTIANPTAATSERLKASAPKPVEVVVDEVALERDKRVAIEKKTQGAWTREAWDLFGWEGVPAKKRDELRTGEKEADGKEGKGKWVYGEVEPVVVGRRVGRSDGEGGAVAEMGEVRALGGFVSAGTGRAVLA